MWVCPQGKLKKMKTDGGEGESPLPEKPQPDKKGAKKTPPSKQVKTAQSKAVMIGNVHNLLGVFVDGGWFVSFLSLLWGQVASKFSA